MRRPIRCPNREQKKRQQNKKTGATAMQTELRTKQLMALIERSIHRLETVTEADVAAMIRPVLVRRRRALAQLRGAMGPTVSPYRRSLPQRGGPVTLAALLEDEHEILAAYDDAIFAARAGGHDTRLLRDQRAEAEQAFLALGRRVTPPAPSSSPIPGARG